MMASDLFFGLNSVDQCAFGIGLGIWVAFFCNGVIRKPLDLHITRLMNGEYTIIGYGPLLRAIAIISVAGILFLLTLYYCLREDIKVDHPKWANTISLHCN